MSRIQTFAEFYPYYLSEHENRMCRRLHFIGSWMALANLAAAVLLSNGWFILLALLSGYSFAWVGHFFFEKNRPATFQYPLYSFLGDWVMFRDILRGRVEI